MEWISSTLFLKKRKCRVTFCLIVAARGQNSVWTVVHFPRRRSLRNVASCPTGTTRGRRNGVDGAWRRDIIVFCERNRYLFLFKTFQDLHVQWSHTRLMCCLVVVLLVLRCDARTRSGQSWRSSLTITMGYTIAWHLRITLVSRNSDARVSHSVMEIGEVNSYWCLYQIFDNRADGDCRARSTPIEFRNTTGSYLRTSVSASSPFSYSRKSNRLWSRGDTTSEPRSGPPTSNFRT